MNLKIYILGEYEDKNGGSKKWEEAVTGEINSAGALTNQAIEALGRMQKHMEEFRDKDPLPQEDEEPQSESEAYHFAHS